jgi:hypothetical protein
MKKVSSVLMMAFIAAMLTTLLFGCALKKKEIGPWLNTISGGKPPQIDINGKWRDTQGTGFFTWGEGYLHQEQNRVRGVIGDYNIEGVVSGKMVYLVFVYGNRVYYTARLELLKDLLTGNYFSARDKEQKKGYPISFVRYS